MVTPCSGWAGWSHDGQRGARRRRRGRGTGDPEARRPPPSSPRRGSTWWAIEKHLVGGECPYYGCVPSKMMIRAANALAEAGRVERPGRGELDRGVLGTGGHPDPRGGHRRLGRHRRGQAARGCRRHRAARPRPAGRATGVVEVDGAALPGRTGGGPQPGDVALSTADRRARRRAVLDQPGRGEAHRAARDRVAVIGGGAIGCELAQAFSRFGVRVTLLEVAPRIMAVEEPEVSELITSVFVREGIRVSPAGADIASVRYAEGRLPPRPRRGRPSRSTSSSSPPVGGRTSPTWDWSSVGLDGSARTLEDRRRDAGAPGRGAGRRGCTRSVT